LRRVFLRTRREEGSTLYEFFWVAMPLMVLAIGIVYGGITFYDYETLAEAVAVGARTMAINGQSAQACYLAEQALIGAAPGLKPANLTVTFPGTATTGTYSLGTLSCTLTERANASIQATYPCAAYFPNLGISLCNVQGSALIAAQTTVRIE
jgi:Flp pilus assembly protein TadG